MFSLSLLQRVDRCQSTPPLRSSQQCHQLPWHRDVRIVAGVDLEVAPAAFALRALEELAEHVDRTDAATIDVAARGWWRLLIESYGLLEGLERVRHAPARCPRHVLGWRIGRHRVGRQPPPVARSARELTHARAHL